MSSARHPHVVHASSASTYEADAVITVTILLLARNESAISSIVGGIDLAKLKEGGRGKSAFYTNESFAVLQSDWLWRAQAYANEVWLYTISDWHIF